MKLFPQKHHKHLQIFDIITSRSWVDMGVTIFVTIYKENQPLHIINKPPSNQDGCTVVLSLT
jgi:hypothetical protein